MSIDIEPKTGNGFIYILSNPAMPKHYKVGLTTNNVRRRISELNTTGVPKSFKAEKVFEIQARHLREVERLAHSKLKDKDLHAGKEFFEGELGDCVVAVEDAIYEITDAKSEELVGKAAMRALANRQAWEKEHANKENEGRALEEKQLRLRDLNRQIDEQRLALKQKIKEETNPSSGADMYFWTPLGVAIGLALIVWLGPIGLLLCVVVYWLNWKEKKQTDEIISQKVIAQLPYKTIDDTIDPLEAPRTAVISNAATYGQKQTRLDR